MTPRRASGARCARSRNEQPITCSSSRAREGGHAGAVTFVLRFGASALRKEQGSKRIHSILRIGELDLPPTMIPGMACTTTCRVA
jgi:hypothetical protein